MSHREHHLMLLQLGLSEALEELLATHLECDDQEANEQVSVPDDYWGLLDDAAP